MMPGMGMADSSNKVARELFIGNTPPDTSEVVLMEFLNAAMNRVGTNDSSALPPSIMWNI